MPELASPTEAAAIAGNDVTKTEEFVCQEPGCGKSFLRERALKRHLSTVHGAPLSESALRAKRRRERAEETPSPAEDSVALQVRAQLRELSLPLHEQMAGIDRRLVEIRREATDLREARTQIETVLRRLEPQPTAVKSSGSNNRIGRAEKQIVIEQYLRDHGDTFPGGFTASQLAAKMKQDGVKPVASPEMTRNILQVLHERGIIRIDRVAQGGGNLYLVVGRNGGATNG